MSRATMGNTLFGPGTVPTRRQFTSRAPVAPTWRKLEPGAVLLAIDPSIARCGWAVIRNVPRHPVRLDSGIFHPIETADRSRFDHLSLLIAQRIRLSRDAGADITDALIETPGGGQRGERSATQLMVYARAVGICEATCYRAKLTVHRVTVTEWKSNSKKSHTGHVARHFFGHQPRDNNEADALGLGLWICSRL